MKISDFDKLFKDIDINFKSVAEGLKIEIAENIYNFMNRNDLNQRKMAKLIGISRAYLNRILKGNVNMTITTASKIKCCLMYEYQGEKTYENN